MKITKKSRRSTNIEDRRGESLADVAKGAIKDAKARRRAAKTREERLDASYEQLNAEMFRDSVKKKMRKKAQQARLAKRSKKKKRRKRTEK